LESVYEKRLKYELEKNNYKVVQQMVVPVVYDNLEMDVDLRLDLLVNGCIVVALKAIENILRVQEVQVFTYMKLLKKPQGLLINFFTDNITKSLKLFVNDFFRMNTEILGVILYVCGYMYLLWQFH
jgi:GxxExxY protein